MRDEGGLGLGMEGLGRQSASEAGEGEAPGPWSMNFRFQANAMSEVEGGEAAPLLSVQATQAKLSGAVGITWACLLTIMNCWGSLGDSPAYILVSLSVNGAKNNP